MNRSQFLGSTKMGYMKNLSIFANLPLQDSATNTMSVTIYSAKSPSNSATIYTIVLTGIRDRTYGAVAEAGYDIQKHIIPDRWGFFSPPSLHPSLRPDEGLGFILATISFLLGLVPLVSL